jgi:WD40 repeat protein
MDALREALRAEADQAPAYEVFAAAIRTARQRARRRVAAACTAFVVLAVGVAGSLSTGLIGHAMPADGGPSLPDRVGAPRGAVPSVTSRPPGPAALIFGGTRLNSGSNGWTTRIVTVGASDDNYRIWQTSDFGAVGHTLAGESVLLSPDGARLAVPPPPAEAWKTGERPLIIDLRSGAALQAPRFAVEDPPFIYALVVPLAWSPDGHTLAVGVLVDRSGQDKYEEIGAIDVSSGAYRKLAAVDLWAGNAWWGEIDLGNVGFSPDGRRLAYQYNRGGGHVVVMRLDSGEATTFDLPASDALAGKAAWTPDGTRLVTVHADDRTDRRGNHHYAWTFTARDPTTGAALQTPGWKIPDSVNAVRILGWSQSGEPVVAAYLPNDRGSTVNRAHLTTYGAVRTVEILRLRTGKGPRLLVRGPDDTLMSIDLASDIITSGKVRPGHPPSAWPTVAAIGTVVVITAGLILTAVLRQRRRHR